MAHYTRYHPGSLHVGLADKPAPMDLSDRHFIFSAADCLGYDVHRTDPVYKHVPLLIRATPGGVVATYSTSHSRGYFSVGCEMDSSWGPFKVCRQDHGGLENYIIIGKTLQHVVSIFAELVGHPLLVPRWAFGYLARTSDSLAPDAANESDMLTRLTDDLASYGIPCSGVYLHTKRIAADASRETEPEARNLFTWAKNCSRDLKAVCDTMHMRGVRLIADLEPLISTSDECFDDLKKAKALIKDPRTGDSGMVHLRYAEQGHNGAYIDFTSTAGCEFWRDGVRALLESGLSCVRHENNEYGVPSDDWNLELSHPAIQDAVRELPGTRQDIGLWGRTMQCELMAKASHGAFVADRPDERPFVVTRCATARTMNYAASSWSGENRTGWASMRGATALSLNAGMCLLQSYGHNVGGSHGPPPSPELLLRWVQLCVHSPRFSIESPRIDVDNGSNIGVQPWTHPQISPEIRKAILRRYELIPYLYSMMLQSHLTAVPPQRWVGWGYEGDREVWSSKVLKDGEMQYWLGDTLLVAGVFESGVSEAKIYLPKNHHSDPGFLNTNPPYQYLPAGQWATVSSPWMSSIPILARIGGAVPIGKDKPTALPGDRPNAGNLSPDDWRGVEIYPPPEEASDGGKVFMCTWMEDDGISPPPVKVASFYLAYAATAKTVAVSLGRDLTGFTPPWVSNGLTVIMPVGDARQVSSADGGAVEPRRQDQCGRKRWQILPVETKCPMADLRNQASDMRSTC